MPTSEYRSSIIQALQLMSQSRDRSRFICSFRKALREIATSG